jgi:acetyl-CoA acetyltransferase
VSRRYAEKDVAITGIGQSEVTRGTARSPIDLTIDAALEAIADAGLTRDDIDGVATWPAGGTESQGFSPVGTPMLQDALRLNVNWYLGSGETSGQLGAVFNAIGSLAAGVTNHVLVYRTVYEAQARKVLPFANAMARSADRVEGPHSWFAPYWSLAAATQQALYFQRYVHESGAEPEQIAQIALNGRRNAALNPKAVYRDPLTLDDYLSSRWISTPLRLYDCDVPCDGSTAIVLSRIERALDMPNPVIRIDAVGSALHDRNSWAHVTNLATQATPSPAAMMWGRTELGPADVDVAELYDGFSFHSLAWLESFGFCGRYEAPAFVQGGHRIALDGEIPINTSGGQLSAGRLHGYGQVHEACTQLWGRGGARQVPGDPLVAVTSTAGGPLAGCMLLVRQTGGS